MTPKRIQRRRVKGWRLPVGAVCVTRPGKYGNPLTMDGDKEAAAEWFAVALEMRRAGTLPPGNQFHRYPSDETIRRELRGRDLACYCSLGAACHCDTLLEIANS